MDRWEYKFAGNNLREDEANALGKQGWEAVGITVNSFVFKRKIEQSPSQNIQQSQQRPSYSDDDYRLGY